MDFIQGFGSNVELEGTSTLGPWKSRSTDIHGQVTLYTDEAQLEGLFDRLETATPNDEVGASTPWLTLAVRAAPIADISVPVISLHGGSSGMDQDMQKALNAAQHPLIEYVFENLQQATVQHDPQNHEAELKLSIVGTIHMAGAERPATMDVIVRRDSRRHFLAHSQVKMLMSDFGVTPPGALFGLIRGGEQVTVTFNLDLALTHDSFAKEQSTRPDRAN